MMTAERTEHVGPFSVELHHDDDAMSPREWDNVGTLYGPREWGFIDRPASHGASDAFRVARYEAAGPIVALLLHIDDGPYTHISQTDDWGYADALYVMPLARLEQEGWAGTMAEQIKSAKACLRAELTDLNRWLEGDCWGYSVADPDGAVVDSCWGYIGEPDYALSEGIAAAEAIKSATPEWVLLQIEAWA